MVQKKSQNWKIKLREKKKSPSERQLRKNKTGPNSSLPLRAQERSLRPTAENTIKFKRVP